MRSVTALVIVFLLVGHIQGDDVIDENEDVTTDVEGEFDPETTEATTDVDPCVLPPDPGSCKIPTLQYYYSVEAQKCLQFIYGGCEGNSNRFQSEALCNATCFSTQNPSDHQSPVKEEDEQDLASLGDENLRLWNGTGQTSFTFSKGNPLIQLNHEMLKGFQLRNTREISFEFRTSDPKGLFLFHTLNSRPNEEVKYELYVTLEGGELKIIHVFGADETTLLIGKALNRDIWHKARIVIDPASGILEAAVDDATTSTVLDSLKQRPSYSVAEDVDSIMFIGGMDIVQDGMESSYLFEHFVGCLRNIKLRGGPSEAELKHINPLTTGFFRDITEGCINSCLGENNCRNGGRCINLYDRTVCDCFGTKYEGDHCDHDVPTVLTLRGYSYLSYRIYDWKDRVHSQSNRISMKFKSHVGDSILFYAGGTFPETNHIAVTLLRNGSLYIEIDFGNSPQGIVLGERLTNGAWHNLTAVHEGRTVRFLLNNKLSGSITVTGDKYHLRFDPHIYVGGDRKPIGPGLLSTNNFVGCLSDVYVNHINILYGLRSGRAQAIYHGILTPELQVCEEVRDIPVTFPFAESEIEIDEAIHESSIDLRLDFKTSQTVAVLAHGGVTMDSGTNGYWEVRLVRGELQFMIIPEAANETDFYVLARTGRRLADGSWHMLKVNYKNEELTLNVDFRFKENVKHDRIVEISDKLVIGTSLADPHLGVVGCMRKISINGEEQDPRLLVNGKVREVSLDSCQLVDPCKRPNACEHGGRCMVDDGRVVCDCTGTGYTGKNCHFALYKRTCEELALLGYHKSGVYEIDIDGNGPHPPAHVRCEFEPSGARKTVVEHNLPTDMEIRSRRVGNVLIDLTYREFTPDMLQSLISQSLQCQQHIRYDCYKAPLELHSFTWFRSSSGAILDYLGSTKPGRCPCATEQQCVHPGLFCNCDGDENKWRLDEGYLTRPEELGITQIFALQPKKLNPAADGRITLGPLECVEANTQQYVVTFKSADSYMEVPGWRTGDLAFSFRTSSEHGILLYQPMLHPKHPYFRVILVNDHELTLEFSINGEPRSVTVKSTRDLNSGEWQQVWIDYNEYHVRFTVNQESILLDLKDGEEFGPFEATLYIGGAPEEMLQASNHSEGLIGCYRGLVMNNEVVNLYAYMNARFPDMIQKHCLPSCDPNPCKNGATCVEFWGSYKCICQNSLAHFGHNCETNINKNALTFRSHGAFVEANATSKADAEKFGLFRFFSDDILLNVRTFDVKSLIFYAYDYMNNFVQLHIDRDSKIVFTFNSEYEIKEVSVSLEGLTAGGSVQILIDREPESTTLSVNGVSSSVAAPLKLITKYKRNPWKNSQLETVKPPRPVRRPEEFYQVFLGGIDAEYIDTTLPGFVGCLRGLKLGRQVIDLMSAHSNDLARDVSLHGVIPGCSMLCDKQPCQNGGVCSEDFISNSFSCDCELTSYFGDTCTEEKGANFGGDSYIFAKHTAVELNSVRVQFAFSTTAVRNLAQALLLVQTGNDNTKYLLVTLTHLGYLRIEEDRDGVVFGAEVKSINFLNGARHSIFYKRKGNVAHLMVDRSDIPIRPLATSIHINMLADVTDVNAIHVGGIKHTSDPRFSDYDKFDGCLSNVYIELDGEEIQPLLIYLGYKKDHDAVTSHDPAGIEEEARCAAFSVNPPGVSEQKSDSGNETYVVDWSPKPPKISPYREIVLYDKTTVDTAGMNRLLVGIGVVFLVMIIFIGLYMWRLDRKHKKRKYEEDESPLLPPPTLTSKQPAKPSLKPTTKDSGVTARLPAAPPKSPPSKPVEDLIQLIDAPQLGSSNPSVPNNVDENQEQLLVVTHEEGPRDDLLKQGRLEPEGEDSPAEPVVDLSPVMENAGNSTETLPEDNPLELSRESVKTVVEPVEDKSLVSEPDDTGIPDAVAIEPTENAVGITESIENLLGEPEDKSSSSEPDGADVPDAVAVEPTENVVGITESTENLLGEPEDKSSSSEPDDADVPDAVAVEPTENAVGMTESTENLLGDPEDQQEYLEETNVMTQSFGADSGIDQDDSPQPTLTYPDASGYPELEPVAELGDFDEDDSLSEANRIFPPILEEEEETHNDCDDSEDCQTPGSVSVHSSESSLNEGTYNPEVVDRHLPEAPQESLKPLRRQQSLPTSGADLHPIYLSDDCRTFTNPISYLGGPRIKKPRPVSQESMVSIDE